MVQLICTDRGQHPQRDIVEMVERSVKAPPGAAARWQVQWRDSWIYPRQRGGRTWQPVLPLHPKYPTDPQRDIIEADVLVFACPTCTRRPRWPRASLDALCDAASAEDIAALDLSHLEN